MTIESNHIYNIDCMEGFKYLDDKSIDYVLTDIPYNFVNRSSHGIRSYDKGFADVITFDVEHFVNEVYRIINNSSTIFCGAEEFSTIFSFFNQQPGTVRKMIWQKSNPSPVNGQYIYESGVELAVWFKRRGGQTFNAFCKNTVFKYPNGSSKGFPTRKNVNLFKELILDNTNPGDLVLDPCIGSGTTAIACMETGRRYIGFELNTDAYNFCMQEINNTNLKVDGR